MSRYTNIITGLEDMLQAGNWSGVLVALANEVFNLTKDPIAKAIVFGSPEFDRYCLEAGDLAWKASGSEALGPFDQGLAVHVATELHHKVGGHTLALKDVIRAQPALRHVILVTNLNNMPLDLPAVVRDMSTPPEVRLAPTGTVVTKTLWLHSQLRELRPGALTLFQHHHDSVAIAGALPQSAFETFYFHHCDADMALGVYLPHAFHVDCSNVAYEKCRHLGVENQVYWPLVSADLGCRPKSHTFMQDRTLTTCSHGSHLKFLSPGRYSYFDLIQKRLEEVNGVHLHIGPLEENIIQTFTNKLMENGIDPLRFKYIKPVASLWAYLRDSNIDLCISSFPIQGAKGMVETMGAGIPVLIQQSTLSKNYSTRDITYKEAFWWQDPGQFIAELQRVTPELLGLQSEFSRKHYELWHHPRELFSAINNGHRTAMLPPSYPMRFDTLAMYYRDSQ